MKLAESSLVREQLGGEAASWEPDGGYVAVDTETSGLYVDSGARVAVVSLAWREGGDRVALALPFDQGMRDKPESWGRQQELELGGTDPNLGEREWVELLAWLRGKKHIYWNAKFDLHKLRVGTRMWAGEDFEAECVWDGPLAERLFEPRGEVSLDASSKRRGLGGKTNISDLKGWLRKRKLGSGRYDLVPWDMIREYAAQDALLTYLVWEDQVARLRELSRGGEEKWEERLVREINLMKVLYRLEQRGVGYDGQGSLAAAEVLEERTRGIEERLPFKATIPGAKQYFFKQKGVRPLKTTEKGEPSLDEETTRRMVRDGVEWAAEWAELSRTKRAVAMWYRGYPELQGPDGRLRCAYRQTQVKSGRMSVERVQLQAVPKRDKVFEGVPHVRDFVRAAEGFGLWNLDLSQAELRVAAKYSRCDTMLEMLQGGADIHGVTTKEVLGVEESDPDWKFKRDIAKRLTFGSIFQIGGQTFQDTLGRLADIYLPLEQCQAMVDAWRRKYPEFGVAYRRSEQLAKQRGWVRLLPNTEYEWPSYFEERDFPNTAWNRIVQGSLAEFLKLWLVDIEENWPGVAVLTVHDSVVLEMPDLGEGSAEREKGDEVAEQIGRRGAEMATELFGVEMKVDTGRW